MSHSSLDDSPDEDIRSAPPPPALARLEQLAGHGIVQNEEWMSSDERQELASRMRPRPMNQSAADLIRERRINCFLCRFGVLSHDAGPRGTGLYQELLRQLGRNLGHMSYEAVAASAQDFVRDRMVPVFDRAGVVLPPFDYEAVLEHISTLQHTKNPLLMIVRMITDMDMDDRIAREWAQQRNQPPDLKARAETRKDRMAMLTAFRAGADMTKLFGYETLDGEIVPDVVQSLAPTVRAVTREHDQTQPATLDWLVAEEERLLDDAAAATTLPHPGLVVDLPHPGFVEDLPRPGLVGDLDNFDVHFSPGHGRD